MLIMRSAYVRTGATHAHKQAECYLGTLFFLGHMFFLGEGERQEVTWSGRMVDKPSRVWLKGVKTCIEALLRLFSGSFKALLRLY